MWRQAKGNPTYEGSEVNASLRMLTVTDNHVFYREETGALAWVRRDGTHCGIVAKVPTRSPADRLDYAMDDQRLYFLEQSQRLWALPRP